MFATGLLFKRVELKEGPGWYFICEDARFYFQGTQRKIIHAFMELTTQHSTSLNQHGIHLEAYSPLGGGGTTTG